MNKNILFFPSYSEHKQVYESLLKLRELGYTVYSLCDKILEHPVDVFEKQLICDITKTKETIEFLKQQNLHFDAIFTNSVELVTPLIALLAKIYGFVGNDPKTAFYCRSKYHMRKKFLENNIPSPKFKLCKNYEDIEKAIQEIKVPCVLKPVGWHSSFGTFMIRDSEDLKKLESNYKTSIEFLLKEIKEICAYEKEDLDLIGMNDEVNMATDYLVEEFMDGQEISVDAMTQNGKTTILGIAQQVRMSPPYFVQLAEKIPYVCDTEKSEKIKELIENTIAAMGIKNSATHTEIIFTEEGPKIVEIACRSGADNIHDAIYNVTGYSTLYENAMIALGVERHYEVETKCHTAMQYILPEKAGILSKFEIPKEVSENPDVLEIKIITKEGSKVAPPPQNFDYIGYVLVKGKTPEEAEQNLQNALNKISIQID